MSPNPNRNSTVNPCPRYSGFDRPSGNSFFRLFSQIFCTKGIHMFTRPIPHSIPKNTTGTYSKPRSPSTSGGQNASATSTGSSSTMMSGPKIPQKHTGALQRNISMMSADCAIRSNTSSTAGLSIRRVSLEGWFLRFMGIAPFLTYCSMVVPDMQDIPSRKNLCSPCNSC